MPQIIEMPKLSDTMTVGTLVKWLKNEGDVVKSGDMLAEVETDKATMELESFFDGTILKIFAPAGSQVALGAPLCAVGKPGETVDAPAGKAPAPAAATPAAAAVPAAAQETGDKGQATTAPKAAPVATPPAAAPAAPAPVAAPQSAEPASGRIKISPLARKLAEEKKIDPSRIKGSGPGGRIVREDVLAAAAAPQSQISNLKSQIGALGARGPIQEERAVPVSNMRGAIARRLLESKTQLPHFYVEIEIDAGPLLALREQLNTGLEKEGVKLSVNDFILKASAEALRRVPAVNGSWEGSQIRYFAAAHVAFAVAIDDGLITPVIRDTHLKSVFQISTEAKTLGKLAKEKKLKPDQFTGGTFCVSNLGMMGIPKFSAIINPPNAAILAVGTTVKKPVVKNDQIVIGQTMTLTLSCDHRVVDGAVGAQYLGALKTLLEAPALLLV
ncbi:pyruvate dehydrogenase complex dihydrolipoamide acetyltransferase [Horticoccus sp. 23ND18S-11]|uniref:pyruvate dehydrogenase complex dihydrolipoamide acetyltransferase n=1 Tax=Horticoccus sp. 23ND18S-11 TaxID=3391832 RepID=UPI0039C9DCBC